MWRHVTLSEHRRLRLLFKSRSIALPKGCRSSASLTCRFPCQPSLRAPPDVILLISVAMSGIFVEGEQTVLYGIPSPPPDFYNVTELSHPGVYIMGHDKFLVKEFHIVGILRRSFGSAEEFLLGMLSVFLIAVLSEIVHVFLMRTTNERHLSATSVIYACLVDELSHFRNIWSHLSAVRRRHGNDRRSLTARQRGAASLVVIAITLGLFFAEVVAVVLTQPIMVKSEKHEYNLKGIQPTGTTRGVARFVRRVAGDRTCVSPIMTEVKQPRNFVLGSCSLLETSEAPAEEAEDEDVSDKIEVGSWYHFGGSDHSITFGSGFFNLRLRADIFLDAKDGGSRRIFFENRDNEDLDHSRYLHERFIYSSLEWTCNKPYSEKTCEELVKELQQDKGQKKIEEIVLWQQKTKGPLKENVTGLVTTFRVGMNAPWRAMNSGIRELYASGVIEEVAGPVKYQSLINDTIEDGAPGLLSEEGRVAGVVLLLIIFGVLFIVLLAIRRMLKPISIAHMVMKRIGDDTRGGSEDQDAMSDFSWGTTSRERDDQSPRAIANPARSRTPGLDSESPDDVVSRMASISTWESTNE